MDDHDYERRYSIQYNTVVANLHGRQKNTGLNFLGWVTRKKWGGRSAPSGRKSPKKVSLLCLPPAYN